MAKIILKKSEYGPRLKKIKPEWSISKNNEFFPPSVIGKKKFWWKCQKGHEWQATYHNRVASQSDCPVCSGRFIDKKNNLYKKHPLLCKEIHPTKNLDFNPLNTHPGSHKKIWWQCQKGHEWQARILMRVKGNNCPYCSGNLVSKDNNLKSMFPNIAEEWHSTKNGKNKPKHFTWGSSKKVWWQCQKGHEWETTISARTHKDKGTNCPLCTHQTSRNEMRILSELIYVFKDLTSRYRLKGTEVDILINKLNLGIEHDGSYWHKDKDKLDRKKNIFLKKIKIKLLRVRHAPLDKISKIDIVLRETQHIQKKDMDKILSNIKKECIKLLSKDELQNIKKYIESESFKNNKLYLKYLSYAPSPLPQSSAESLATEKIKSEWHLTKNIPLTLRNFYPKSRHKAWWQCQKGHEWQAIIASRVSGNHDCPFCKNRYVNEDNNLAKMLPTIAAEWHPTKNRNLKPEDFTYRSSTKVWWKCKKGHVWRNTIASRYAKNVVRGCQKCHYQNRSKNAKNI